MDGKKIKAFTSKRKLLKSKKVRMCKLTGADNPSVAPVVRHLPLLGGGLFFDETIPHPFCGSFLYWGILLCSYSIAPPFAGGDFRGSFFTLQRFIFPFFLHILLRYQIIYTDLRNNTAAV